MAYLGNNLQVAYQSYQIIDDISGSFNGILTTFPLQVGGVTPVPFPINPQQCLISVNGVIQEPDPSGTSGFNLVGSNIEFSSAPTGGHAFFGVILAGADYVNVGVNYPSGSESAPSITFDTDLDTGVYNPAVNELGLVTNGNDAIRINSSGDVTLSADLTVNTNTLYVDSSNNRVGIGTTTPVTRMDVAGNVTVGRNATSGYRHLHFFDERENISSRFARISKNYDSPFDFKVYASTSSISAPICFNTTLTSEAARIDGSGRLLVGVSSSLDLNAPIQVASTAYGIESFRFSTSATGAGGAIELARSNSGTIGTTSAITSGQGLGVVRFRGAGDSSTYLTGAEIEATSDGGTVSASSMPTSLVFSTAANGDSSPTERMRITSNGTTTFYGNVGIDISGTGSFEVRSDSLANLETIYTGARAGGGQVGRVGVYKHSGISTPTGFLRVECEDGNAGIIWVDNSDVVRVSNAMANVGTTGGTVVGSQTSDERLKNIFGPIEYGLETVKQLAPVRYALKDDPSVERLGFIAQQTQPVVPEAVYDTKEQIEGEPENAPNKLAMEYVTLVPVLVNAIKELSAEVDAIKIKIDALETQ